MNRVQWIKTLGFVGAVATGTAAMIAGDIVSGVGIISAALSSSTLLQKSSTNVGGN